MLYSIATLTLSILYFIFYWFVINLISGESVSPLPILIMASLSYLYLSIARYCVASESVPVSTGPNNNMVSLYYPFLLFTILTLLLLNYENITYYIDYLLLSKIEIILLGIETIIMPIIFWYNLLLSILYLVEWLGIYDIYTVYKKKLALCNFLVKQLQSVSIFITYLVDIVRMAMSIIYVISVGLFIYRYMQSSLSFLDLLQFILFIYYLYKAIDLSITTNNTKSNSIFYMKLLFYLIAMVIFLPAFTKVTSVLLTIVNIIGKGKGKAPEPPHSGSNSSSPSSPPSGPNPPPGTDSVPLHDNSNNNQVEEESGDTNIWETYNVNAWEKAGQEHEDFVAGPSETPKERKNRLRREKRAARTPEEIAKDLEKARAYDKKRKDTMSLEKRESRLQYLKDHRKNKTEEEKIKDRDYHRNWKKNRTQEKVEQDREKDRIYQQKVRDNMTEQEREQYLAKAREQGKNYWNSLDESGKEARREYNRNYYNTLSEEQKLDYDIRKEKNWKKKLKKNQKKDKDDKTSKKK